MIATLPILSSWLANKHEASIQDLGLPLVICLITALLAPLAVKKLWKTDRLTAILTVVVATLIITTDYQDRLDALYPLFKAINPLPKLIDWPVYSLVFIVLALIASRLLAKTLAAAVDRMKWNRRDIFGGVALAVVATFVLNAGPVAVQVAGAWPQYFYKPIQLPAATAAAAKADKPDIYYIVLDRYTNNDVMKSQFGYDNSDFLQFLSDKGYYVNNSGHNNYPYTTMSIASTMAAGYNNDIINRFAGSDAQTTVPFDETVRNSPVASALKSIGYDYTLLGNWYETSNRSDLANTASLTAGRLTIFGQTITLNNLAKNYLTHSAVWRFMDFGWSVGNFKILSYENLGDVDMDLYQLGQLKALANAKSGGRFVFAHLLMPHDPYYFNADGSLSNISGNDNYGAPLKQKYVGQVKFVNDQMKNILTAIDKNSGGKAVVVLQSDEGPYPNQLNDQQLDFATSSSELGKGDMTKWSPANLRMKYGNLAAYHIPAADFSRPAVADAADNANVFRLVFNSYFGYDFGYLPDCYYAYPDGRDRPMIFTDITKQLTGKTPDARCSSNGTVN